MSIRLCLLFAVFVFVLLPSESGARNRSGWTSIFINGTITCPYRKEKWCFAARLVEKDLMENSDDILDIFGVHCLSGTKTGFQLQSFENGDGPFNKEYEFDLTISHTCAPGHKIRRQIHRYEPQSVNLRVLNDLNKNITLYFDLKHSDIVDDY